MTSNLLTSFLLKVKYLHCFIGISEFTPTQKVTRTSLAISSASTSQIITKPIHFNHITFPHEILSSHRKLQRSRNRVQLQQDILFFTKKKLISQNFHNFSILTLQRVGFLTFYNVKKTNNTTKHH